MQDPLSDPFTAIIKLTTGEEIISIVSYDDDNPGLVLLQNPMQVESANSREGPDKNTVMKGFKLDLWLKSCMEPHEVFVMHRDKIVTMTEASPSIVSFYDDNIEYVYRASVPNRIKPSREMGHQGSIKKARKLFEKLYRT
tara:strand:+ start:170 stop:589 length:420 start_codon:yes stop_codon:yes gene_type:complete